MNLEATPNLGRRMWTSLIVWKTRRQTLLPSSCIILSHLPHLLQEGLLEVSFKVRSFYVTYFWRPIIISCSCGYLNVFFWSLQREGIVSIRLAFLLQTQRREEISFLSSPYSLNQNEKWYAHGLCALPQGEMVCFGCLFFEFDLKKGMPLLKGREKVYSCQIMIWFLFSYM